MLVSKYPRLGMDRERMQQAFTTPLPARRYVCNKLYCAGAQLCGSDELNQEVALRGEVDSRTEAARLVEQQER